MPDTDLGGSGTIQDMLSMVPADLFDGTPPPEPVSEGSEGSIDTGDDSSIDLGDDSSSTAQSEAAPAEEIDTTVGDATDEGQPPAGDQPPAAPPVAQPQDPDLPEGVKLGKDRKGKEGAWVDKTRWETAIYPAYQLARDAAAIIGEPLTKENLQVRERALTENNRIWDHLNSGDPELQGKFFDFALDEMNAAHSNGETAIDPGAGFASSFYDKLQQKSQSGYAALRLRAATDLLTEVYQTAAETKNIDLFKAAQHFSRLLSGVSIDVKDPVKIAQGAKAVGLPWHMPAEMAELAGNGSVPGGGETSKLMARIDELEARLEGRTQADVNSQLTNWNTSTNKAIAKGLYDDVITPALSTVKDAWKEYPKEYKQFVEDRLHSEVLTKLNSSPEFRNTISGLRAKAARATNPAYRAEIAKQIAQTYINRAKIHASDKEIKGPILEFATTWLAKRSDRNNGRLSDAQTRTTAKGTNAPVPRSIIPKDIISPDEVYDPKKAAALANRLLMQ